jgi:hypothetical protein
MDFSSLVLMEREKETNFLIKEMGSYEVSDGAKYIRKMFYDGENVVIYFDCERDVEEWEYTAIFDLFDEKELALAGFTIENVEDEYNPTWCTKFPYNEEHEVVQDKLKQLCSIIEIEMDKVFDEIKGKENEYK